MSGYTGFVNGGWYTSDNYQPAQTLFAYPDFVDLTGLNLLGSAVQGVLFDQDTGQEIKVLQLTDETQLQTGAAWFDIKQQIANGFETTFEFWILRDGAT